MKKLRASKEIATIADLKIGQKVYFEDEHGESYGKIHYLLNEQEQEFQESVHGEKCISIMPNGSTRARFIPISQIVLC